MPLSTIDQTGLTSPLVLTADITVNGLTVGRGAGSVSTNTAVGASALAANTTGSRATASGYLAGTTSNASQVSYFGSYAGQYATGSFNTAIGDASFAGVNGSSSGQYNVAVGGGALNADTTGGNNTSVGFQSLYFNTTASNNTAVGYQAGYSNTTGGTNAFFGRNSGYTQTTATANTFIGANAGYYVTTGSKNTIIGQFDGQTGLDIRTASNYIVLSDGDGNPRLYMDGSGYLYSAPTYVNTTGGSANLRMTGSNGQFALSTSSLRYKKNIENAPYGLADVMAIRPVIYQSKSIIDGDKTFGGFIAEEIHDAGLTQFVDYDDEGRPNSLQYGNMVSLCVKAIQELKAEFDAYKASHP